MFSSKIITFIALIAVICFAALFVLQVMEWTHFNASNLWPGN